MTFLHSIALSGLCASVLFGCYESHVVEATPSASDGAREEPGDPPEPSNTAGTSDRSDTPTAPVSGPSDRPPPPTPPTKKGSPIRFVALGDGGTGGEAQYAVAAAMGRVCARRGCDFALYLGDNIYENGVSSPDDSQFETKFEAPYANLHFPFFVVLGNHDYGPYAEEQADFQVDYTQRSDKWFMPSRYYTVRVGPVAFFALDTNALLHDGPDDLNTQRQWLLDELSRSDAPWTIALGHHPYISNGYHGSAGHFDGQQPDSALSGQALADLTEEALCGRAQLYLAGHDHDREWLEPTCGTHFVVSGAAAKLRPIARDEHPSRFQDADHHGFLWVEVDDTQLRGIFFDENGTANYEDRIVLKPPQ